VNSLNITAKIEAIFLSNFTSSLAQWTVPQSQGLQHTKNVLMQIRNNCRQKNSLSCWFHKLQINIKHNHRSRKKYNFMCVYLHYCKSRPSTGQWAVVVLCSLEGNLNLALHQPCVTDSVVYPPAGSMA